MPQYNVMLKDNAPESALDAAKKKATDAGGTITKEFTLVRGFTVQYAGGSDGVGALQSDQNVSVEADAGVSTQ